MSKLPTVTIVNIYNEWKDEELPKVFGIFKREGLTSDDITHALGMEVAITYSNWMAENLK